MKKYTQSQLKALVRSGAAENITNYNFTQMNEFLHAHSLDKIGYSSGVYGLNGGLMKDTQTGQLYAITARNTALAMAF